jgi:hypothetical protein
MAESMSDLAVAIARLKAAKDIAEQDNVGFQQRRGEFLSALLDAYGALFRAQDERSTLLARINELESLAAMRERYKLVSLGAANVVAYAPKLPEASEPPHYLCANCFNAGKVSYLQQTLHGPYVHKYRCNTCTEELSVDTGRPRPQSALPGRRGGGPNSWMGV